MYTNLNQESVEEHIFALLDLIFNTTKRRYLCIGWNKSFFSQKTYNGYRCFDVSQFKEAIHFVLSEVYITFGDTVFKQVKGIPMGGNCSPLLADLFLMHCEFIFMQKIVKDKKYGLAKLLSNTSRYIDDVSIINYRHFDTLLNSIYPNDLLAERNGENNKDIVYLDVHINVQDHGLRTKIYHKVDDFNFNVVLLTFPNSAIPYNLGINVCAGQILRYLRICSHLDDAVYKSNKTLQLLKERGYSGTQIKRCTERLLAKHFNVLFKFGLYSPKQFTSLCNL